MPMTSNRFPYPKIVAYSAGLAVVVAGMEHLFDVFGGATGPGFPPIPRSAELLACSFAVFFAFLVVLGRRPLPPIPIRERPAREPVGFPEAPMRLAKTRQILSSSPKFTELLRSHLSEANRIGGESALSVLEQISRVQREASRLLASLAAARAEAVARRRDADGLISTSRRKLTEMEDGSHLREGAIRDGNAAIERTIALMETLASLTGTIGMLSQRTRLIAFNAAIKATNDSSIGRGFVAVADEMRKLAVQIESTSNQVDEVMGRISRTVKEKLVGMASIDLLETERERMHGLTASLARMSADFEATVSGLDRLSADLHASVEAMFAALLKTQESSQSQDISRQQIELVQEGLALCGARLGGAAEDPFIGSGAETPTLDDVARTLEGKYAMRAQRAVHDRLVSATIDESPETRTTIELF